MDHFARPRPHVNPAHESTAKLLTALVGLKEAAEAFQAVPAAFRPADWLSSCRSVQMVLLTASLLHVELMAGAGPEVLAMLKRGCRRGQRSHSAERADRDEACMPRLYR